MKRRGVGRAGRQDEFAPRTDRKDASVLLDVDTNCAALIDQDAADMRAGHDRQIGSVRKRMCIGAVQRPAPAALNEHVGDGAASRHFQHRAVRARKCRDALFTRSAEESGREGARVVRGGPSVPRKRASGAPCQFSMRR